MGLKWPPNLIIFIKDEMIPANENPMHRPRVPPTEPIIEIASYIQYSSWTFIEFEAILYPNPIVMFVSTISTSLKSSPL